MELRGVIFWLKCEDGYVVVFRELVILLLEK